MSQRGNMTIQKNKVVTIQYTLTDESGVLIESSDGQEPLTYIHGVGNIIPGLESSLEGKGAGHSLKVSVPPADAYGEWDQEKIIEIPRAQFSGVDDVQTGMQFGVHSSAGEQIVTVTKVEGETVTVDANHPLAGKALNFDVTVVAIRDATPDELDHGHAHGPGGHH
jgi:FKBP-type peptidyl-prolyl cis-trans isomerase SlyD